MASLQPFGQLAIVRRHEAAGFRAWPATNVAYDGTWAIRLTHGHPAKRLNSVNPLDPGDSVNIVGRIASAARRFEAANRPLTFRISPLAGPLLTAYFDRYGWRRFSESIVMRVNLSDMALDDVLNQIPLKDVGRFIHAALGISGSDHATREGLAAIIGAIEPEAGLFVLKPGDRPVASAICVHDGDLAGLFEVATDERERGKGYGKRLVQSAMKWARLRGAKEGWLQVEADNLAAVRLYAALGFSEIYRYHYRRPPGD